MSLFSDRAKKFMDKYKIDFLSGSKRCIRISPMTQYFISPTDKNIAQDCLPTYDTEPLITVDIPLSKLEQLANLESMFYDNIEDANPRSIFRRWVDQQEEEYRLRTKFDSVRKAYEHYSAMLSWCGKTHKKITDLPPEDNEL